MIVCNMNNNFTTAICSFLMLFVLFISLSVIYYFNIVYCVIFIILSIVMLTTFIFLLICINKKIIIDKDEVVIVNKKNKTIINSIEILYIEILVRNRYEGILKNVDFPKYIIHTKNKEFSIYNKKFHLVFNDTFLSSCAIRRLKIR